MISLHAILNTYTSKWKNKGYVNSLSKVLYKVTVKIILSPTSAIVTLNSKKYILVNKQINILCHWDKNIKRDKLYFTFSPLAHLASETLPFWVRWQGAGDGVEGRE